nr:hypothetical protein [Tanacetum cinerariifolium]
YLQNEQYALWELIEFGDSYQAPLEEIGKGSASESFAMKKGRTVAITIKDMHKRRNDVKAIATLMLALRDEHQLRFSKLQAIVSHLEFIDIEIEQDDLNQKFFTRLAPEWLIVQTGSTHVSTASIDVAAASISHDTLVSTSQRWNASIATRWAILLGNAEHLEVKTEERKKGTDKEENHALVADEEALTEFALMAKSSSSSEKEVKAKVVEFKTQEIKFYEKIRGLERDVEVRNNKIENLMNELELIKKEKEGLDYKLTGFESALKDLDTLLGNQRTDKNKEGLPEFADDTVTDYSRPTPCIDSS